MDVIIEGILFDHLRSEEEQLAKVENQIAREIDRHNRAVAMLEGNAQPIRERVEALRAVFEESE